MTYETFSGGRIRVEPVRAGFLAGICGLIQEEVVLAGRALAHARPVTDRAGLIAGQTLLKSLVSEILSLTGDLEDKIKLDFF